MVFHSAQISLCLTTHSDFAGLPLLVAIQGLLSKYCK